MHGDDGFPLPDVALLRLPAGVPGWPSSDVLRAFCWADSNPYGAGYTRHGDWEALGLCAEHHYAITGRELGSAPLTLTA